MPEPPRRKRFQIHLSTAIVMMIVAGVLIWANVAPRQFDDSRTFNNYERITAGDITGFFYYPSVWTTECGWPTTMSTKHTVLHSVKTPEFQEISVNSPRGILESREWHLGTIINTVVALFILFLIWFACEWLIRRRAARKGA